MTTEALAPIQLGAEETALLAGDLSKLNEQQRAALVSSVCRSLGLNPLTRPLQYIQLNNKLTLYATKDCTDQLRRIYRVSTQIVGRELAPEGIYVVTARAAMPDGRSEERLGAVSVSGLRGEALANAYMKCETKAVRRVSLAICGLGFLDETEVETIPGARMVETAPAAIAESPAPRQLHAAAPERPLPPAPVWRQALYAELTKRLHTAGQHMIAMPPDLPADQAMALLGDAVVWLLERLPVDDRPLTAKEAAQLAGYLRRWAEAGVPLSMQIPTTYQRGIWLWQLLRDVGTRVTTGEILSEPAPQPAAAAAEGDDDLPF